MLDVGCPEPALVLARIESTRSCAANAATVSSPVCAVRVLVVMGSPGLRRGGVCPQQRVLLWPARRSRAASPSGARAPGRPAESGAGAAAGPGLGGAPVPPRQR